MDKSTNTTVMEPTPTFCEFRDFAASTFFPLLITHTYIFQDVSCILGKWSNDHPGIVMTPEHFIEVWRNAYPNQSVLSMTNAFVMFQYQSILANLPPQYKVSEDNYLCARALCLLVNHDQQKIDETSLDVITKMIDVTNFGSEVRQTPVWQPGFVLTESVRPKCSERNQKMDNFLVIFFKKNMNNESFIAGLNFDTINFLINKLVVDLSDLQIFEIICIWIKYNYPTVSERKSLLSSISFASLGTNCLIDNVFPTGLLSDSEFAKAIVDSRDPSKNISQRKMSQHSIGIGYHGKNYPGFRMFTKADFNEHMTSLFLETFTKHKGFVALEDISLNGLIDFEKAIVSSDHDLISSGNTGIWSVFTEQLRGSICEISFNGFVKNHPDAKFDNLKPFYFNTNCKEAKFTFYIRI